MRSLIGVSWCLVFGVIAAALSGAACVTGAESSESGDEEGGVGNGSAAAAGTCPTGTADLSAAKNIVVQKCNGCHNFNPDNPGGSAYSRAADGSMPPSNPLSSAEVEQLRALVACSGGSGSATSPGGGEDGEGESEGDD